LTDAFKSLQLPLFPHPHVWKPNIEHRAVGDSI
jgi:hypothetical protein